MNPDSIKIHYGLGQLFIYKGETEKAMQHFEKVVSKEPENYEAIKVCIELIYIIKVTDLSMLPCRNSRRCTLNPLTLAQNQSFTLINSRGS